MKVYFILLVFLLLNLPSLAQEGRPSFNTGSGFFVKNGKIYDHAGIEFVPYGVNNVHVWLNEANSLNALRTELRKSKLNTVRLVTTGESWTWNQQSITPEQKRNLVQTAIDARIIPVLEFHDGTCLHDIDRAAGEGKMGLKQIVDHWLLPENVKICKDFEQYLMVNIANEWGPDNTSASEGDFLTGYKDAITRMRNAGIKNVLIIDAGGCGQDPYTLLKYGEQLLAHDPQHNVVVSVHLYGLWRTNDRTFTDWTPPFSVEELIPDLANLEVPVIIGEFGWTDPGTSVNYDPKTLLNICKEQGIGWLFWAWHSNDAEVSYNITARSDLKYTSSADLTAAGKYLVEDAEFGFKAIAKPASIFSTVTGTESKALKKAFVFHPNPGTDIIRIDGQLSDNYFQIFDNSGRFIKEGNVSENHREISVSDLTAGTYTFRIFKKREFASFKFEKK